MSQQGKKRASGEVLIWPKDMYGCRKNSLGRANATSTYMRKQAWADPQSSPRSTYAAELENCDESDIAVITANVINADGKQTYVLPVNNFVSIFNVADI